MDRVNDLSQPADPGVPVRRGPLAWSSERLRRIARSPTVINPGEVLILFAVGLFLLLYGLVPYFGGDQLGLVGADEPRYAQIAREMLAAHNQGCAALHADMVPTSLHA